MPALMGESGNVENPSAEQPGRGQSPPSWSFTALCLIDDLHRHSRNAGHVAAYPLEVSLTQGLKTRPSA